MTKILNIEGRRFGRLIVISLDPKRKYGRTQWNVKCDCGTEFKTITNSLMRGLCKSCGCLKKELFVQMGHKNKTHGMRHTKIYAVWHGIKNRCCNPNSQDWKNYGGRGITICQEWLDFSNFYRDVGDIPKRGLTMERKDVNKGYEPNNVKWATNAEQQRNKRNNRVLQTPVGPMFLCDASKFFEVDGATLMYRINRKWPMHLVYPSFWN